MIERHITFNLHEGSGAAFEAFFRTRYRPAMADSPGFVRAELLRELDQPQRYQMVLRFDDVESATAWRTSAVHEGLQPELNAFHGGTEIAAYEVVA